MKSNQKRLLLAALAVGLAALSIPAARAGDDLQLILSSLPAETASHGKLFTYSERLPDDKYGGFLIHVSENAFGAATMAESNKGATRQRQLTGLDFNLMDRALTIPGDKVDTIVLWGKPGFADETPVALTARGFALSRIEGTAVYTKGEDYSFNLANPELDDPFGRYRGQAQRMALFAGRIVVTAGTEDMRCLLAGMAAPPACPVCTQSWQMIEALRQVAGPGTLIKEADAYSNAAFIGSIYPQALLSGETDYAALAAKIKTLPKLTMPVFTTALLAEIATAGGVRTGLVLTYPDRPAAEAGSAEIVRRINSGRISIRGAEPSGVLVPNETVAAIKVTLRDRADGVIAVILVETQAASTDHLMSLLAAWRWQIAGRDFAILQLLE